jgi:four helix bundle protein
MEVWQKAITLAVKVFDLSNDLPRSEDYGLTSQIRKPSNSVSANIAEAFGRNSPSDKCKFYVYSKGSAFETQNHLIYGNKVGYFNSTKSIELINSYDSIIHELNKIIKTLGSSTT